MVTCLVTVVVAAYAGAGVEAAFAKLRALRSRVTSR
jgi:hypothetical protein